MKSSRRGSASFDALTVFLGAFLLFQIQPIIAACILPWFGGAAAVWAVCMLFFQVVLLLGYLYAHAAPRMLRARGHVVLHVALLVASVMMLPIAPSDGWKPTGTENPATHILALLTATVGLPYFLLSTTGPLVQLWLVRRSSETQPYRLFALGNLAALAGLVAYPFVIQPIAGVRTQLHWWSVVYAAYVMLATVAALRVLRVAERIEQPDGAMGATDAELDLDTRILWVALAACPSVLLLAITNHLTKNVAPVPFLWVLPLSIYLVTFVLCFDHPRWHHPRLYRTLMVPAFGAAVFGLSPYSRLLGLPGTIALFTGVLFVCCMTCHGELSRTKPHPDHLTGFYLMVALGGALGGVFVALVAPILFVTYLELPIGLCGCLMLVVLVLYRNTQPDRRRRGRGVLAMVAATLLVYLGTVAERIPPGTRARVRNFFGTLETRDVADQWGRRRILAHGVVVHGSQFLDEARRREPTAYYGRSSGVGLVLAQLGERGPLRVGVVGLGAGVLAAYGRREDYFRFYELNPLVERVARSEFTFLADDPATTDVVIGDGRLVLDHEPNQRFDVLVLDAFSGDAIPLHLLTREAFGIYFRHVGERGIVAVHVSNVFLDLAPVVAAAADAWSRRTLLFTDEGAAEQATALSGWVVVVSANDPTVALDSLVPVSASAASLWTDDHCNLLAAYGGGARTTSR